MLSLGSRESERNETILRYQTISVRASKNSNTVCPFLYLTETEHSLHFKLERT